MNEPSRLRKYFLSSLNLSTRERRLLCAGAAIVILALAADVLYRVWIPRVVVRMSSYRIETTSTRERAEEIGATLDLLLDTYRATLGAILPAGDPDRTFQARLYRNRKEFRRSHRDIRWAEAFYRSPVTHSYYAEFEINRYQFFFHEAVHQLNRELGRFPVRRWLNEGLATYFSSSRITPEGTLDLRIIDLEAYPSFWIYLMAKTGDFTRDVENTSIIPLDILVRDRGGPDMDEHFNLYYVHWWTLAFFLFHYDEGKYAPGMVNLVKQGGTLESFEHYIGPVEEVQREWYAFVVDLRKRITSVVDTSLVAGVEIR